MTDIAELSVPISADTKAIDAALRKVEADLAKLGSKAPPIKLPQIDLPSGDPIGEPFRKGVPSIEAAERATLSFAQARARLLRDQGDLAGAERVLQGALNATTASTTRTIAVQRQLLAVRKQITAASADEASSIAQQSSLMQKLGGAAVLAGGAFAAVGAANAALDIARAGASADLARSSFDRMAASAGTTGDALLNQLSSAAKGTVAQTDLVRSSNTALLLLGNEVASKLPQLLGIATASAQTLGTDVGQVFDSLVTGISRGSTELIDNAGITVKAEEAYAAYAASIGASADGLSSAQKQQAILNAVLTSGQDIVNRTAGGANESALAIQQFDAALADLTSTGSKFVAQVGAPVAQGLAAVARSATAGAEATAASGGTDAAALDPLIQASYESLTGAVRAYADAQIAAGASTGQALVAAQSYGQTLDAISAAQATVSEQWDGSAETAAALAERMTTLANESAGNELTIRALASAYADGSLSITQLEGSLAAMEAAQAAAAAATTQAADASAVQASATELAAAAANEAAVAATAKALADLEQAAASEQASLVQDQLRDAILNAAAAGGDAEAAATAIARVFQGVEVPAVLALINAHRNLAAARRGAAGATEARDERNGAAARAEIGSMKAVAAQQERLAVARKAEADAARASAAATRGTGGGGRRATGGGGASARVSAAQKAAQDVARAEEQYRKASEAAEEAYRDRALDAEEAYQERRLSIMEDFAAKRRDAEMSFADAQVSDRADFYTSLIGVDKASRTQMIQEYEAAQAKAADIAATQGADAGERYLSLITDIIKKRADRAVAIQKALEDGDKKEAEFLRGVDAIARADEERKLARATEGGDNLAGQEQDALANAATQRDDALAKAAEQRQDAIATAAERAGDASVTAQQRLAQAAATSNIPLQEQLATLERIKQLGATGGATAPATGTGTAPAAVPTTAPAAPPVATPPGGGPVATFDAAAVAAIIDLGPKLDRVRSAIGDLRSSGALGGG